MMIIVRWLGSLSFAIFLIAALAVLLVFSTFAESIHGTPSVQRAVYQAEWFDAFLGLLAVNIICSTVLRWPFRKYHTGFVLTHTGILILLIGSILARVSGGEGQMMLAEGMSSERIQQSGDVLTVHTSDHKSVSFPLDVPAAGKERLKLGGGLDLFVHGAVERASLERSLKEDPKAAQVNRAVRLTFSSASMGFTQTVELAEQDPANPHSRRVSVGAGTIELAEPVIPGQEQAAESAFPKLGIVHDASGEAVWIELSKADPFEDRPLGSTGYTLSDLSYYPDARVGAENRLESVSEEPLNPAVRFAIVDPQGAREEHTHFALFPEFASTHGKAGGSAGFSVRLTAPGPDDPHSGRHAGAKLTIRWPGKSWTYSSSSTKGDTPEQPLEEGRAYPTGWMDFSIKVEGLFTHAVFEQKIQTDGSSGPGVPAADISLLHDGKELERRWVLSGEPERFETPAGAMVLSLEPRTSALPFSLKLEDFRKVDYPGTRNASSYESDVVLTDPELGITLKKTISMNRPLDHRGWRIFQSSFMQDPRQGEASVFTIAKNPGIGLIYGGSIVMFLGIFLVFYVKPLSTLKR